MLTRRRFLAGAPVGLALAAMPRIRSRLAGDDPGPQARVELESELPYRLPVPGLTYEGAFPVVHVSQLSPYQGGAIYVSATNALSGAARVFGREYLLSPGPEGIAGFVGFGTEDRPGRAVLAVALAGELGEQFDYAYDLTVRPTQWTFDDIYIPPPDPNASPSTRPPLPNEQPRLDQLYAGVSQRLWEGPWLIPLGLGGEVWVSGYFGEQRSFNGGPRQGHHGGTDIAAPEGTPIHATNRGTVVLAEETLNRGNLVVLDHGAGVFSCYGHQSALRVTVGDLVQRGDVLGLVGTTGLSTGPHLHWELAVGGVLVDGLRWLDGTQGF